MAVYTITLEDQVSAPAQRASAAVRGLADAVRGLAANMGGMSQAVQGMAPQIQQVATATQGMGSAATGATPAIAGLPPQLLAVAAAAAVVIGAITAVGAAIYTLGLQAIGFADKRARVLATFNALTEGAGQQTVDALSKLSAQLPFSGVQVQDWAKKLAAAGFQGDALTRAVRTVASATAIMGEEGGAAAQNLLGKLELMGKLGAPIKFDRRMITAMKEAGIQVDDLAARLGTTADKLRTMGVSAEKLGDAIQSSLADKGKEALSAMRNSLEGIGLEVSKGIGLKELFSDLGPAIKPFMAELRSFASEFFKGSTAATAAKGVVTSVFTTLFEWATRATRAAHIGFLTVAIFALQAAIAVAPVVNAIRRFVAEHGGINLVVTALKGVAIVLGVIASAVLIAISPFILAGTIITGIAVAVVFAIGWIAENVGKLGSSIKAAAVGAYAAASDFVSGLVDGIKDGVGRVVDAAKDLAMGAVNAVRGALDSHSPSRVMMRVGLDTAAGMAVGMQAGANDVADASTELAGRAIPKVAASATGRTGAGGTYNLRAELHVHNYSGDALEMTEEAFASMLDRLARQAGLAPDEEAA
jgi:hypothetical protein